MLLFQTDVVNIGTADLWATQGGILGLIIFSLLTMLAMVVGFSFFKLTNAITGLTDAFHAMRMAGSETNAEVAKQLALLTEHVKDNRETAQAERSAMTRLIKEGFADQSRLMTSVLLKGNETKSE